VAVDRLFQSLNIELMETVWQELKGKDELSKCKTCGKRIWKFWHTPTERNADGTLKDPPEMTECGPCYFKHG